MQANEHTPPCPPLIKVQEFIDGNGKIGAKTRLALLEDDVCDMKTTLKQVRGWIVGAAITVITGVVLWMFTTIVPAIMKVI
jgi:hypothetical protein